MDGTEMAGIFFYHPMDWIGIQTDRKIRPSMIPFLCPPPPPGETDVDGL